MSHKRDAVDRCTDAEFDIVADGVSDHIGRVVGKPKQLYQISHVCQFQIRVVGDITAPNALQVLKI